MLDYDAEGSVSFAKRLAKRIRPGSLRLVLSLCPLCGGPRPFIKLDDNEIAVRCVGCRASAVSLSMVAVLKERVPDLKTRKACEFSARGPLHRFLGAHAASLAASEYFPALPSGAHHQGVRCEDVQKLSYPDRSFDLCTCTDVFEHVPDDAAGFAEVRRVLRPGGLFVFTVPLSGEPETLERAVLEQDGRIRHLAEPEYHGDPVGESGRILAFRTYGDDIVDRLLAAGFSRAAVVAPVHEAPWGYARGVLVAEA